MPAVSNAKLIAAIQKSHGLVAVAARQLGISRQQIYRRIERDKKVRDAVEEARDFTTDLAEAALFRAINNGESWAVTLRLKTHGKHRGYVETVRSEVTGADGGPVKMEDVTKAPDAELRDRAAALVSRLTVLGNGTTGATS